MDQVASLFGQKDQLLAFDCLSQEISNFSLPLVGVKLFLIDSKVKHNLAESAYNERRTQLEDAFKKALALFPKLKSWRDIDPEQVAILCADLDATSQKRLHYILDEMARVEMVQLLSNKIAKQVTKGKEEKIDDLNFLKAQYQQLGALINETHVGLRDLYEVSCIELDFLQHELLNNPSILGARMMGGGFGGCLLVLAKADFNFHSLEAVFTAYQLRYRQNPSIEPIQLMGGVKIC